MGCGSYELRKYYTLNNVWSLSIKRLTSIYLKYHVIISQYVKKKDKDNLFLNIGDFEILQHYRT